jgi:hypothetical protein
MTFVCGGPSAPSEALRVLSRLTSCCEGAAYDGPTACTCWEAEYDAEQVPPDEAAEPVTRAEMCADCAFRPDSPERSGDDRYEHSDGDLAGLDHFWCHQGMRKPARWRHPLGITVEADVDAYNPPRRVREVDGERVAVPYKANGSPGDRCGGFDAWKRLRLAERESAGG